MGQLALGVAGAVVGAYFGGPVGAQAGFALGSLAGAIAFPSGQDTYYEGPRLGDLAVTSSTYGMGIAEGTGTARIGGNIIWSGGIEEVKTTEEQDIGKGGGPTATSVTYSYYCSFAVGLCRGEKSGILRMWADGKLIFDQSGSSDVQSIDGMNYRFYPGSETQLPDSVIEAKEGVGEVPAHRGLCYIVFNRLPLNSFGNRIPSITVEVADAQSTSKNFTFGSVAAAQTGTLLYDPGSNRIHSWSTTGVNTYDADSMAFIRFDAMEDMLLPATLSDLGGSGSFNFSCAMVGEDRFFAITPNIGEHSFWKGRTVFIDKWTFREVRTTDENAPSLGPIAAPMGTFVMSNNNVESLATAKSDVFFSVNGFNDGCFFYVARTGLVVNVDLSYLTGIASLTDTRCAAVGPSTTDGGRYVILGFSPSTFVGSPSPIKLVRIKCWNGIISVLPETYDPDLFPDWLARVESTDEINNTDLGYSSGTYIRQDAILYDATDDTLIIWGKFGSTSFTGDGTFVAKVDYHSGTLLWKTEGVYVPNYLSPAWPNQKVYNGLFAWTNQSTILYRLDTATGTVTSEVWGGSGVPTFSYESVYVGKKGSVYSFGFLDHFGYVRVKLNTATGEPQAVRNYVEEICAEVGLEVGEYDASALDGEMIWGYYWANPTKALDVMGPMATRYMFDMVESDGKIKFVKRGGASVVSINNDKLEVVDNDSLDVLTGTTTSEQELPAKLTFAYADRERDYQSNAATCKRPSAPALTMNSDNQFNTQSPIAMTATEAKQTAEKLLYSSWNERTAYQLHPSNQFMYLDPTDVVTVTLSNGFSVDLRVSKQFIGADFSLQWEATGVDGATYTSTATGDGGQIPVNVLPVTMPVVIFLLDLPLLRDTDITSESVTSDYVAAAGAYSTGFRGAYGYQSYDGFNYSLSFQMTVEVCFGAIVDALPDSDIYAVDYDTVLSITVRSGSDQIQSTTYDELMAGGNAMAVLCSNDEWEVIQFMTATPTGEGTFDLTGLVRGCKGTDWLTGLHNAGDRFVFLNSTRMSRISMPIADVNTSKAWKGVGYGEFIDEVSAEGFTTHGNEWKPWMPVQWQCELSGSDIDITWERRTRFNGGLTDGTGEVPLNEDAEEYELEIYDAAGTVLLRTVTGLSSPDYTYLAADISTDFGATPDSLNLKIYQVSSITEVGRGFSRLQNIEVL